MPDPAPSLTASRKRRLLLPLLILAMAAIVATWGGRREMGRATEIQRQLEQLCAPDGAAAATGVPAVPGLQEKLEELRRDSVAIDVSVQPGDVPAFGDGTATHHAVISVEAIPHLGLRLVYNAKAPVAPQRVTVTGYWLPRPPTPNP